jgi:hypothetical protein
MMSTSLDGQFCCNMVECESGRRAPTGTAMRMRIVSVVPCNKSEQTAPSSDMTAQHAPQCTSMHAQIASTPSLSIGHAQAHTVKWLSSSQLWVQIACFARHKVEPVERSMLPQHRDVRIAVWRGKVHGLPPLHCRHPCAYPLAGRRHVIPTEELSAQLKSLYERPEHQICQGHLLTSQIWTPALTDDPSQISADLFKLLFLHRSGILADTPVPRALRADQVQAC